MAKTVHKEYQVINLTLEYGGALSGFKYAVTSYLPEKELRIKYEKELAKYAPYLYLTGEQGEAITESIRNNRKFHRRQHENDDIYGYEDGVVAAYHSDVQALLGGIQDVVKDPLDILVSREEYEEEQRVLNKRLSALEKAMEALTERQLRRFRMAYIEELTEAEISRREKVDISVVHRSIKGAEKKLRKIIRKNT